MSKEDNQDDMSDNKSMNKNEDKNQNDKEIENNEGEVYARETYTRLVNASNLLFRKVTRCNAEENYYASNNINKNTAVVT